MSSANAPERPAEESADLRDEWLGRLTTLVDQVEGWAKELGWFTRRIDKKLRDSEIGSYLAVALLMQKDTTPVLLEPVARSAPGADGVVDLYLMPTYDDIASLYYYGGEWNLHSLSHDQKAVATIREADSKPLSKDALNEVLEEMRQHAA
ncbi:MAG: hypothetical protein P4L84_08600 [Isosphaeraceae bacterium]|nr:hypothetical protein [Isosphaeraceae bacterium]